MMSRIFGDLLQIGFVVPDIEAAMQHWAERLGVGPWYYIERLDVPDFEYMGQPSPVELSLALANSGDMQIELIQQRNELQQELRRLAACRICGQRQDEIERVNQS